jgi:hypothetical protein
MFPNFDENSFHCRACVFFRAKRTSLDFSDWAFGQLGSKNDTFRGLVVGQPFPGERNQLGFRDCVARSQGHKSDNSFSPEMIWPANDAHLSHRGVLV